MICICGKQMKRTKQNVPRSVGYPGGYYGIEDEEEDGCLCECGLFIGNTAAVFNGKSYPFWGYSSEDVKKIMEEKNNG